VTVFEQEDGEILVSRRMVPVGDWMCELLVDRSRRDSDDSLTSACSEIDLGTQPRANGPQGHTSISALRFSDAWISSEYRHQVTGALRCNAGYGALLKTLQGGEHGGAWSEQNTCWW
jgi:hypothetical protein